MSIRFILARSMLDSSSKAEQQAKESRLSPMEVDTKENTTKIRGLRDRACIRVPMAHNTLGILRMEKRMAKES